MTRQKFIAAGAAITVALAAAGFATNPVNRDAAPASAAPANAAPANAAPSSTAEADAPEQDWPAVAQRPAPEAVAEAVATPADAPSVAGREVLEVQTGSASYYASSLAGRRTASGERYDPRELVAAHRKLPFGTVLRVTNVKDGRSVEVRVIDRGPFARGRVLDVSRRAADALGMIRKGHVPVRIEVLSYGS